MNQFLGKTSELESISIKGTIFKGDGTRLTSHLMISEEYSHYSYNIVKRYNLDIKYEVKDGRYYTDLFTINWNGKFEKECKNYKQSFIFLKNLKNSSFTPANEKKILKLNKKGFDGTNGNNSSILVPNPIIFCKIPFLEDAVKDWILTVGIQDLSAADIKKMMKKVNID